MNGAADLGGMMGFGPVVPESEKPVFHADWERRVFAVTLAMGFTGSWNLDQSRFARESLPPAQYLSSSYYQIWLAGLEKLLLERGLVTADELQTGRPGNSFPVVKRTLKAGDVAAVLAGGSPADRPNKVPAQFSVGDRVFAKNMHPQSHTRLPRYLRGHAGTIRAIHGTHVFPDSNAEGRGEDPHWLYSVAFTARELWGADRPDTDLVMADCWEPCLDRA